MKRSEVELSGWQFTCRWLRICSVAVPIAIGAVALAHFVFGWPYPADSLFGVGVEAVLVLAMMRVEDRRRDSTQEAR